MIPHCLSPRAGTVYLGLVWMVLASPSRGADGTPPEDKSGLPAPALTEVWTPVPPVIAAPEGRPPADAIVLFDGRSLDAWESVKGGPARWLIEGGALVIKPKSGSIRTKTAFGDLQLHLEFRTPAVVEGEGQRRGNSGIFFMGLYELQILDSYDNKTYVNGQAASIYKQRAPLVNASRSPGEWQSYDVIWVAPRFTKDERMDSPARITVFHNGVLVHHNVAIKGGTAFRGPPAYQVHVSRLPLELQDHKNPTAFRNIWVRELALPRGA